MIPASLRLCHSERVQRAPSLLARPRDHLCYSVQPTQPLYILSMHFPSTLTCCCAPGSPLWAVTQGHGTHLRLVATCSAYIQTRIGVRGIASLRATSAGISPAVTMVADGSILRECNRLDRSSRLLRNSENFTSRSVTANSAYRFSLKWSMAWRCNRRSSGCSPTACSNLL